MAREIIEVDGTKYTTCTKCGELKPIDQFHKKSANTGTGLQSWCKECAKLHPTHNREPHNNETGLSDKPLCKCTPRELLAELKSRGYVWDKMWVQQYVEYSKI